MDDFTEAYIGIEEAATVTGYNPGYLRRLCRERKIPFHRWSPRGHYLFLVSELRAWLRGSGKGAGDE